MILRPKYKDYFLIVYFNYTNDSLNGSLIVYKDTIGLDYFQKNT